MKRFLGLFLSVLMLLALAACGDSRAEPAPSGTSAPSAASTSVPTASEPAETEAEETVPGTVAPGTLVDDENCGFAVISTAVSDYAGMELEVLCTNKTDRTLMFAWTDVSVCGYQYDPLWSQEVAPGEAVTGTVGIDTYQLENWGIRTVDQIGFTLQVFDSEDFMAQPYVEKAFEIFPTGLTADTVTYPDRMAVEGEQVVIQQADVVFIIERFSDDASGYTLDVYLENGTDREQMFSWEDVCVNGAAVDPMWSEMVSAGKRTFAQVHFPADVLESQQIEAVEQIELTLLVTDPDSGEQVLSKTYTFDPGASAVG